MLDLLDKVMEVGVYITVTIVGALSLAMLFNAFVQLWK